MKYARIISLLVGLVILTMVLPGVVSAQSISSSVINTTPKAQFTSNTTQGQSPLTVQFIDQSTGTAPLTYAWDFNNDGSTDSTVKSPSFTYLTAGDYTVNLTVTNADGSDSETTTTITVLSPLAPGTTTSPTLTPNQTTTTTTTTVQTSVLTTATTAPIATTYTTPIPTLSPTTNVTVPTPWPTDTPTQPSPLGIEIGIIAIIGAALLIMKRK